jgi:hypothetical protein
MVTVEQLIESLKTYKPGAVLAVNIWCIDDVHQQADELGIKLTDEVATSIVRDMDINYDANEGLTWDVCRDYIAKYVKVK